MSSFPQAVAIALFVVMALSWPVAAYVAAAKIRRFPRRVTVRYVVTACVLTLWLGVLFTDAAALKVKESPWIEWALPVGWILCGVLVVVVHWLLRRRSVAASSLLRGR